MSAGWYGFCALLLSNDEVPPKQFRNAISCRQCFIISSSLKSLGLIESIKHITGYLSSTLRKMPDLRKGNAPINHAFLLKNNDI